MGTGKDDELYPQAKQTKIKTQGVVLATSGMKRDISSKQFGFLSEAWTEGEGGRVGR